MAQREYWIGLPVGITVRDDGSITVEVDMSEASDGMREQWANAEEDSDLGRESESQVLLDMAVVDANPARSSNATSYIAPAVAEMTCPARYACGFKTFSRAEMASHLTDPAEKHGDV